MKNLKKKIIAITAAAAVSVSSLALFACDDKKPEEPKTLSESLMSFTGTAKMGDCAFKDLGFGAMQVAPGFYSGLQAESKASEFEFPVSSGVLNITSLGAGTGYFDMKTGYIYYAAPMLDNYSSTFALDTYSATQLLPPVGFFTDVIDDAIADKDENIQVTVEGDTTRYSYTLDMKDGVNAVIGFASTYYSTTLITLADDMSAGFIPKEDGTDSDFEDVLDYVVSLVAANKDKTGKQLLAYIDAILKDSGENLSVEVITAMLEQEGIPASEYIEAYGDYSVKAIIGAITVGDTITFDEEKLKTPPTDEEFATSLETYKQMILGYMRETKFSDLVSENFPAAHALISKAIEDKLSAKSFSFTVYATVTKDVFSSFGVDSNVEFENASGVRELLPQEVLTIIDAVKKTSLLKLNFTSGEGFEVPAFDKIQRSIAGVENRYVYAKSGKNTTFDLKLGSDVSKIAFVPSEDALIDPGFTFDTKKGTVIVPQDKRDMGTYTYMVMYSDGGVVMVQLTVLPEFGEVVNSLKPQA